MTDHRTLLSTCTCGQVRLEATGRPIVTVTCYCASCQAAGQKFAALPGATSVLREDGGTDFILFRKDRIRCLAGKEVLREHRLTPASKTQSARFMARLLGAWVAMGFRAPKIDFV